MKNTHFPDARPRRLVAAISLVLMSNVALAQETQSTSDNQEQNNAQEIEQVTVYGLSFQSEGVLAISEKEIAETMATSTNELFRNVPNLEALQGPGRQFFDFNLRGTEGAGSVIVTVDGAEKNLVTTKHGTSFNPVFVVPEFLKTVTVIQGPVSNTFGTGSTGGRVQLETVDPFDFVGIEQNIGGEVRVNGENNGDGRLATGIAAASLSDNFGVLAAFSDRHYENYEDGNGDEVINSGSESRNFLGKFQWEPAAGWMVEGSHSRSEIEYTGSNIFARSNQRQDADFLNDVTDTGTQIMVDYNPGLGFSWHADAFISTTEHIETLLENRRGAGGDPGDFDSRDVETVGGKLYFSKQLNYGDINIDMSAGVSGSKDELKFNEDGADESGERANYGAFVQGQVQLTDAFSLVPGLRFERYDLSTLSGIDNDGGEWLPKLTANYEVLPGVIAYTTWAKGLRAPRLNEMLLGSTTETSRRGVTTITTELPSENLEAELSDTYELGLRFNRNLSEDSRIYGSLGIFRNNNSNRIERVILSNETEGNTTRITRQNQNVGETRTEGLELAIEYAYKNYLLGATFAANDGERLDTGEELNSVRPNRGTLYAGWQGWDNKFNVRVEMESFASKEEIGENDNVVGDDAEGATVGNLFASWQVSDGMIIRARINNISDRFYRRFDQIDNSIGRNMRLEFGARF